METKDILIETAKKNWVNPSVTEISKHVILGVKHTGKKDTNSTKS